MLYPDGSGDQRFWSSQARNAFIAFTLYLFENFDQEMSLDVLFERQAVPDVGRGLPFVDQRRRQSCVNICNV